MSLEIFLKELWVEKRSDNWVIKMDPFHRFVGEYMIADAKWYNAMNQKFGGSIPESVRMSITQHFFEGKEMTPEQKQYVYAMIEGDEIWLEEYLQALAGYFPLFHPFMVFATEPQRIVSQIMLREIRGVH